MKKLTAIFLLAVLILLSAAGMFSCRSVKKSDTKADSTATRTEKTTAEWDRTTVTEIFADTKPTFAVSALPVIYRIPELPVYEQKTDIEASKPLIKKLSFIQKLRKKKLKDIVASRPATADSRPLIARITTTEKVKLSEQKKEEKKVHVDQKLKESGVSTSRVFTNIMICLVILLAVLIILYQSKKSD